MFTLTDIKNAHSKVKSGADFPAYIRELKKMGVVEYDTFVVDGHTEYRGAESFKVTSPAGYDALPVIATSNKDQFVADLKAHQAGQTDYPTFCRDAAKSGVEKWRVRMDTMTCTYFDRTGNELLVEAIPQ